ncbi:polysaccharide lyase family 8 super-sandwich domain-containing protein [Bacillus sp. REN16]|uniref:polysaccharide lyase family 8 super-sandwich domain-containing protein n=1 Tax=Bacillus sp. REN16 TaxID=2887296 RepID=UPI001E5CF0FE|nr:polysaccharide lyase family 8 super-sandwich domain-containing protein [Bacillus sp. REN16]MCC3355344.1 polysaccharide lyase beta-sandwich domain-containing protein [Bacillus sp. REN16]
MRSIRRIGILTVICFLVLTSLTGNQFFANANNVNNANLLNPGFEETVDPGGGWDGLGASNWNVWVPTGDPIVSISEEARMEGKYGLLIRANETARTSVNQDIPVTGGDHYRVSSWLKTDNIVSGQGARIRITTFVGDQQLDLIYSDRFTGTHDWTKIEKDLDLPAEVDRIRVQLFFETGTGTAMFDNVSVEHINPAKKITIHEEEITLVEQESTKLHLMVEPSNSSSTITWLSLDEKVAMIENGKVFAVGEGETKIIVFSDNGLQDSVTVKVSRNEEMAKPELEKISLKPAELALVTGQVRVIDVISQPQDAVTDNLVWSSSNQEVVNVKNGVVEALGAGSAVVKVQNEEGTLTSETTFTVTEAIKDEYDGLRKRWESSLTSNEYYDPTNERMIQVIENQTTKAEHLWRTMNKNQERSFLWIEYSAFDNSSDIRDSYRNLTAMAKSFANEHSTLYQNPELFKDIASGLEWLYENHYNESISQWSNWWHWEIGVPKELNDLMVLLYDYVDLDTVHRYLAVVDHFQPDPTKSGATTPNNYREAVGANRIDVSKVVAVRGVIVKDSGKIAAARDALSQTFLNVTQGDGFYEDGSFIQHEDVAYTGSYGNVLLEGLTDMLELLSDSTWKVTDPNVENVYEWVGKSYEPLMYKGALMDMVRGRAISRSFLQDHQAGQTIIKTVIRMAEFAPEPYAQKYKAMAKFWIEEDEYYNYFKNTSNFKDYSLAQDLINDASVISRGELDLHVTYANMDRIIHRKTGYAFGISMYSKRVQNYEDMNNENRKGWYTGEGMTYLYNGDLAQYSDDFWATVNPYRMPGTTIDTMHRADGSGEHNSTQTWVGGSTLNTYGTAGMSYDAWNSTLVAKKSWFMFNDEIVALGAGISSDETRNVETIIENRKIRDDGSNRLIINGEIQDGKEKTLTANWAFLEGTVKGADIGYYFPNEKQITVKKEERTGAWSDINYTEPTDKVSRSYASMWINHGVAPQQDTYAYVLLPSKSQEQTEQYALNPDIEILKNDDAVQAVYDKREHIVGANFWTNERQTVGPLTVDQQASITMQAKDGVLEIAVSDPTMENEGYIEIEIEGKAFSVLEADKNIEVVKTKPSIKLKVNVKDAKGETFKTKLKLIPNQYKF